MVPKSYCVREDLSWLPKQGTHNGIESPGEGGLVPAPGKNIIERNGNRVFCWQWRLWRGSLRKTLLRHFGQVALIGKYFMLARFLHPAVHHGHRGRGSHCSRTRSYARPFRRGSPQQAPERDGRTPRARPGAVHPGDTAEQQGERVHIATESRSDARRLADPFPAALRCFGRVRRCPAWHSGKGST